jgi:hypothetical protein
MTSTSLLPVVGPIAAALIAGAIAFLASVLSKEQKTSEFRQSWIDGLRQDLAELLSLTNLIHDVVSTMAKKGKSADAIQAFMYEDRAEFGKLEACVARIRLRLNPDEHQGLMKAVLELAKPSVLVAKGDTSEVSARSETVITESQRVLKAEWKRVKRGEPIFATTKWLSLLLLLAALITGATLIAGRVVLSYAP